MQVGQIKVHFINIYDSELKYTFFKSTKVNNTHIPFTTFVNIEILISYSIFSLKYLCDT